MASARIWPLVQKDFVVGRLGRFVTEVQDHLQYSVCIIYVSVCVCVCWFCYTCEDQVLRRNLLCEDISLCEDLLGGPRKNNAVMAP